MSFSNSYWKVFVDGRDLSDSVKSIHIDYKADLLVHASFSVTGEFAIASLRTMAPVELSLGTLRGYTNNDTTQYRKKAFKGTIRAVDLELSDSGTAKANVTCVGKGFSQEVHYEAYPSAEESDTLRTWAKKEKIKASEILKNIAEGMGLKTNSSDLKLLGDLEFSLDAPLIQKDLTDQALLNKLVSYLGCHLYIEKNEDGDSFLRVVASTKQESGDLVFFRVMLREGESLDSFEPIEPSATNQIQIRNVSVSHDVADASKVRNNKVTYFDEGELKELTTWTYSRKDENGKDINEYYTYELNDYYKSLSDEEQKKVERKLNTEGGLTKEEQTKFFKRARSYDTRARFKIKPYFGIEVEATCDGDFRPVRGKYYNVKGILQYDSTSQRYTTTDARFLLVSVLHNCDKEGFTTTLKFRR
ncbi:hypothetical protein [Flammeovirga agarivorans]|uniref:Uncharacterized protein n=1 Tax=Flammeovirga agarivorans TaxID=2726742 RepID=A0A7X8XZ60_9BACT|nr:hypothetical protein [Flammeovirga agarivorans]NLR94862.1 hypothetical protein [Flammeovirga agarivorans]